MGWAFAREAPKNFAGLLSAGAAPVLVDAEMRRALGEDGFALVMTAGSADFNHTEVHTAATRLAQLGLPARTIHFDGPHGWPPESTIDRAITWFELGAMASGRARVDSSWADAQFERELQVADSLRGAGQTAVAADRCAELALQLERFASATRRRAQARACADSLARSEPVRRFRARAGELEKRELAAMRTVAARLDNISLSTRPSELRERMGLPDLVKAAQSGDSLERPWAADTRLGAGHARVFMSLARRWTGAILSAPWCC